MIKKKLNIEEQLQNECDLCNELEGKDCYFRAIYQQDMRERIIFRTTNFAVIPTIGQIVEGYVLILPFKHYTAIGALPDELYAELEALMDFTKKAIISTYGVKPIFFEHGVPYEGGESGGCGVYHMHLHVVPLNYEVNFQASIPLPFKRIASLYQLQDIISEGRSYLLYIDQEGNKFLNDSDHIPSQYMRRKLAEVLGSKDWDWRSFQKEERLIMTYKKLSKIMNGVRVLL
jgi:diadenosine tetraphosphate (Ap4A) HIT family hydrolase